MTALLGLATRLGLARLQLITGARTQTGDLAEFADDCFAGGVDLMQLRDPGATDTELLSALKTMRRVSFRYQGLVSVYESAQLAQDFETDVFHLPERGMLAQQSRKFLHQWALVGRSCHTKEQVDTALSDPQVNYLTVGPIFGGLTASGGLELVRYTAQLAPPGDPASKPWFAVGGITAGTLDKVFDAGARRISVSRAVTAANGPGAAAVSLKERLRRVWDSDPAMQHLTLQMFRA